MRGKSSILLVAVAVAAVAGIWIALGGPIETDPVAGVSALAPEAGVERGEPGAALPNEEQMAEARAGEAGRARLSSAPSVEAAELLAGGADDPPRLVGRVVGPGEVPIADAAVHLRRSEFWLAIPADLEEIESLAQHGLHLETRTGADGRFVFESVEPGDWSLAVRAPGFAPLDRERQRLPRHQIFDLGLFALSRGIVLEGRVVDAASKGVSGARILRAVTPEGGSLRLSLPGFGIPLGESAADGSFRLDTLASGNWLLIFDSPGHRVAELAGATSPAGEVRRGLVVQLDPGLPIAGRIEGLDTLAGAPVRVTARVAEQQPTGAGEGILGAERHRPRHAEVAPEGAFSIAGLAPGVQYRVAAYRWEPKEDAAEEAAPEGAEVGAWTTFSGIDSALAMAGTRELVLRRRPTASIALRAVDERTSAPIERFAVTVQGSEVGGGGLLESAGEPVLDHPGGRASYESLRPTAAGSTVTLVVQAPGYEPLERGGILLRPGDQKDLGELALRPAAGLRVRVLEEMDDAPIPGARVLLARAADSERLTRFLFPDPQSASDPWSDARVRFADADAQGVAVVTAWAGEVCVLRACAPDHVDSAEARAVPPHEGAEVEVRMQRAGRARILVRDERGAPVTGIYVERSEEGTQNDTRLRWDPALQARQTSDEAGLVSFEDLRPGLHVFRALENGQQFNFDGGDEASEAPQASLELRSGELVEGEIVLPERGGFRAVVLQAGEPLVGALASLQDPDAPTRNRYGTFRPGSQDRTRCLSDHEGRIAFQGLATGWYQLVVSHPERRMSTKVDVEVVPSPAERRIELGLSTIEGRVTGEAGEGLAHLSVDVASTRRENDASSMDFRLSITESESGEPDYEMEEVGRRTVETDAEGRYVLRGVRSDEELQVRLSGNHVVGDSRTLAPLSRDEVRRDVDFSLAAAGCLEVQISGMPSGNVRYSVSLIRQDEDGREDRTGSRMQSSRPRRTFCSLRPGRWTIEVSRVEDRTVLARAEAEVRALETRQVAIALP